MRTSSSTDLSCLPEHTDELPSAVPGLPVTRIPDAGHLPPSDNPAAFRAALAPILADVAVRSRTASGEPSRTASTAAD